MQNALKNISRANKYNTWEVVQFDVVNNTSEDRYVDLFKWTVSNPISTTAEEQTYPNKLGDYFSIPKANTGVIAYSIESNLLYIGSTSGFELYVFDPETNTLLTTLIITDIPTSICYDSFNNRIYCGLNNGTVAVLDCSTNTFIYNINTGIADAINSIVFDKNNNRVYFSQFVTNTVYYADTSTNTIGGSFTDTQEIGSVSYCTSKDTVYITKNTGSTILELSSDLMTSVGVVSVGFNSFASVYCEDENTLYFQYLKAGNFYTSKVDCATNTHISTLAIANKGRVENYIVVPNFKVIYYADFGSNTNDSVDILNYQTDTVVDSILTFGSETVNRGWVAYVNSKNSVYTSFTPNLTVKKLNLLEIKVDESFYIVGSTNYNEFIYDSDNNPKLVRQIRMIPTDIRSVTGAVSFVDSKRTGEKLTRYKLPLMEGFSKYQYQNIYDLLFDNSFPYIIKNDTYMGNVFVPAFSKIILLVAYRQMSMVEYFTGKKLKICDMLDLCPENNGDYRDKVYEYEIQNEQILKLQPFNFVKNG